MPPSARSNSSSRTARQARCFDWRPNSRDWRPLRLGPDSKSERGYALLTDAGPPHLGTAGLVIPDHARLGDVFPMLLSAACRDFAAELSGAGKGDIEGVHRLRAAIRKTRTLFVLFAPVLEPVATARFNDGLRDFGQVLGSGRDWDVFLTETLAEAEADLGRRTAPTRPRSRGSAGPGRARRRRDHSRRPVADGSAARPVALDRRRRLAGRGTGTPQGDRRCRLPKGAPRPARQARRQGCEARSAPEVARARTICTSFARP